MLVQSPRDLIEKLVDTEQSYWWLKSGDINGETESIIVAAQDQAISTNYFKNRILKEEIDSKCRLCNIMKKLLTIWPQVLHSGEERILNETR